MKTVAIKKIRGDEYRLYKSYDAGIVLQGWEVKSIRASRVDIRNAYCYFRQRELFLINMHIKCWMLEKCDETRERKLLLTRNELNKLAAEVEVSRCVIIPQRLFWSRKFLKLQIVVAKKMRKAEKRVLAKERQVRAETDREIHKYVDH